MKSVLLGIALAGSVLMGCQDSGEIVTTGGGNPCPDGGDENSGAACPWALRAPMPSQRVYFSVVTLNGKIYVIGGSQTNAAGQVGTVEEYDPAIDVWTNCGTGCAPMPTVRSGLVAEAVNEKYTHLAVLPKTQARSLTSLSQRSRSSIL